MGCSSAESETSAPLDLKARGEHVHVQFRDHHFQAELSECADGGIHLLIGRRVHVVVALNPDARDRHTLGLKFPQQLHCTFELGFILQVVVVVVEFGLGSASCANWNALAM